MKSSHLLAFAALLGLSGTVSAAWTRLPSTESKPVNLAAKGMPGTKILASKGVDNPTNLISADPSVSAHISGGKSEVTIQIINQQMLELVSFVNDGVEGNVVCAGSPDQKTWSPLGRAAFSANERMVQVSFAGVQAKYVSVSIESAQGGTIRALKVYGSSTGKDFALKPTAKSGDVNLVGGVGGGRAIYAFPAPAGVGEMGARYNVFKFPNTGDKYRIIVYDLGMPRTIREFSTAYSQHPVRLEVFAFQELPEKKDWRGKMTLDPAIFDQSRPVATGEDARGVGHIKVMPSKPIVAQFVALRFEPNYQRAATGANFEASWGDLAQLTLGSAAPVLDAFNLLPQGQFTVANGGGFTVSDINVGSTGYTIVPTNGTGADGQDGTGNQPGTTANGTPVDGAPPYLPGTPGSPPAGSGGLSGSGTSGTGTGSSNNPGNVNVTVSGAGSGNNGGGGAGNPGTNNPQTAEP